MVNKKIVIIVTIIAIIVVAGIVYFSLNIEAQNQYTFSEQNVENQVENDAQNNTIVKENSTKEDVSEEKEEEKEEKEDKQEVEENQVSKTETNEVEEEEKEQAEKLDNKDTAIELAKKEWGENDNTVYYYVEEQVSDNVYIISVRDNSTTQDLLTYKVNVNKKSVEEY